MNQDSRRRLTLAACIALLITLATLGIPVPESQVSFWDMQDTTLLLEWLAGVAVVGLIRLLQFLLFGILLSVALSGTATTRNRRSVPFRSLLLSTTLGFILTMSIVLLKGGPAVAVHLALAGVACLVGVWIGWCCVRGRRARLWLIPQLLVVVAAIAGTVVWAGTLAVEPSPLAFQPAKVTSAEKRRLVDMVRRADCRNDTRFLRLSSRDANLLLTWGLSLGSESRKARVGFQADEADVLVSMALPRGHHLNLHGKVRLRIDAKQGDMAIVRLRIGRLRFPSFLLDWFSRSLVRAVHQDPDIGPAMESVQSLRIRPDTIEIAANRGEMGRHIRALLARFGPPSDIAAKTRVYIEHLLAEADDLPEGDERFEGFVRAAFELARQRSEDGDPAVENRAAIYALGIMLGHWRVEQLIGAVTDGRLRALMRERRGTITVRGRADWVRHFCVSAALAPLSSEIASDAAGLLKEELDAGQGGSGFSFSDLLADRAGTVLAVAATQDKRSAERIQRLLASQWEIDAIFPRAADLPEGLSDSELQTRYGGVGGANYRKMIEEIELRLDGTIGRRSLNTNVEPSCLIPSRTIPAVDVHAVAFNVPRPPRFPLALDNGSGGRVHTIELVHAWLPCRAQLGEAASGPESVSGPARRRSCALSHSILPLQGVDNYE